MQYPIFKTTTNNRAPEVNCIDLPIPLCCPFLGVHNYRSFKWNRFHQDVELLGIDPQGPWAPHIHPKGSPQGNRHGNIIPL